MDSGKTIAAFFDIDGTLSRESMLIHHFKRLIKYGIIDEQEWVDRIRPLYRRYDQRYAEYDDYLDEVTAVYKDYLEGLDSSIIEFTAKQIVDEYGDVVYKYTRERIEWHKNQGHKVFFISGSPDFIIDKMAERYHITDYKATAYKKNEVGIFTSEIVPMWDSESKERTIHEFVDQYNIDLACSYSYGDTNGDFSMFQLVGHPTAINPSYRLLKMIQDNYDVAIRIAIVVERKDVIYKFTSDVTAQNAMLFDALTIHEPIRDFVDDWDIK